MLNATRKQHLLFMAVCEVCQKSNHDRDYYILCSGKNKKKKSHMTTFFLLLSWIMMSNSLFYGLRELHHPSAFFLKSPQQNSKSLSALLKSNRDTCFKYMAKLFDRGGSTSDKWFKRWVRADRLASNHIIIAFLVFTASNGSWHLVDVDLTRLGFDLQFDLSYSKLWQCL